MRCDCRRRKHQAEELELSLTRQEAAYNAMLSSSQSGSGLGEDWPEWKLEAGPVLQGFSHEVKGAFPRK